MKIGDKVLVICADMFIGTVTGVNHFGVMVNECRPFFYDEVVLLESVKNG